MVEISDEDRTVELIKLFRYEAEGSLTHHVMTIRAADVQLLRRLGAIAHESGGPNGAQITTLHFRDCSFRHIATR